MDSLINEIIADPGVRELLAPPDPVFAPSFLVKAVLQVDTLASVTQAEIDSVRNVPGVGEAFDATTGVDTDGTPIAIATINLADTNDERIYAASRTVDELANADEGPLRVSSISPVVVEDEYKRATEEGMAPLVGAAFLLIAALILLFMRTVSDLLLTLGGLLLSIIWVVGAEGWLGPNALGLVGPPNSLTTMVPIILIGLTVDYAIQIVSHYREQRLAGEEVVGAVRMGLRHVTLPLTLAAVTTIVSLLVSLFSPIGIVNDFGVIAGLGVGMSLLVMLTLIPAGRTIIDRRRAARGKLKAPRPISTALPRDQPDGGVAGEGSDPQSHALYRRRARDHCRARIRGQGPRVGVQHPRHPPQGRGTAGGHEHARCSHRGLDGDGQRAAEGRSHGHPHAHRPP